MREEIICNHVTNCKLLIRRKFLNSGSRPGFFNDGLQVSSKYPVCKERLTILVMAGRSESKHEDARFVLSRCNQMTNCLSRLALEVGKYNITRFIFQVGFGR